MERIDHFMADIKSRMTYAVGIDPGVSTGLAIIRGDGFRMHVQQGTPSQILDDFTIRFPFLTLPSSEVLVGCERFVQDTTNHKSAQPIPLQVIGIVVQMARLNGWKLFLQGPADVKAFVNNDILRTTKLWVTARDVEQHDANDANDAMRHALTVLAHRRASMFEHIITNAGV
jgi:hypothetical protein